MIPSFHANLCCTTRTMHASDIVRCMQTDNIYNVCTLSATILENSALLLCNIEHRANDFLTHCTHSWRRVRNNIKNGRIHNIKNAFYQHIMYK